jgi:peptidoglycan/xylan/chitin deacetylase (PgdA/CDA1 family)
MWRWLSWVLVIVVVAGLGAVAWDRLRRPDPSEMHWFEGVVGPRDVSRVAPPAPTRLSEFDRGGPHRLAVLVTDPDSGWLGLVRGFRALGVPITVTTDVDRALRHKVVLAYPIVSGRVLERPEIQALAQHVREGGTVVAFNLAGGGLEDLFGVRTGPETSARTRLRWQFPRDAETETVVSGSGEARVGSVGYAATTARVEGRFEDGTAAAACRSVGDGRACVLGIDLGSLAQRSMNGRAESLSRGYVNGYEPSLDTLFRWLRDIYVAEDPMPWLISTTPSGYDVSILFTHDVDFGPSVVNAATYSEALKTRGIQGTFFVQTKYLKDYNDSIFFDQAAVPLLRRLVGDGMDVGSHTVSHSRMFESMPLGTGKERYPDYRPRVTSDTGVSDASILGELRVSKYLLEHLTGADVQSFRPGRLSYPFALPQAMAATGYRYSSSITANVVLTHLPFQMTDGRADGALQPVYEFPVTIEDEALPRLGERLQAGHQLIERISRHGGVVVILVHPNVAGHKLEFVEGIADHWRGRAWMGSLAEFGGWWANRDALETDIVFEGGGWHLRAASETGVDHVDVILPKAAGRRIGLAIAAGEHVDMAL